MKEVCVDAGLVVREPDSPQAEALFRCWARDGVQAIAPAFFSVEAESILCQKLVLRGELTEPLADEAFAMLQRLPILQLSLPGQRDRAWQIARAFSFPTVYDATYPALAELSGCEFWTADARLVNRVSRRLSFVRSLGDVDPGVAAPSAPP